MAMLWFTWELAGNGEIEYRDDGLLHHVHGVSCAGVSVAD
jgi:hypothetical protein